MGHRSIAVLACALVAATAQGVHAETPSGALYVTTLPAGADIWVDRTYVGRAPVLVDALGPGRHAVTITKTGWVVQEVDVTVAAGAVTMSSIHLAAGPRAFAVDAGGSLIVRSFPPGAELTIDGLRVAAGAGKNIPLPAGAHRLGLKTKRGTTTRTITIVPATTTDVVLSEPAGDAPAAVVAPADDYVPAEDVSIEGKKVVVRYAGHVVVAYFGDPHVRIDGASVVYDGAPQSIGGKLYLPLALLEKLTADEANAK